MAALADVDDSVELSIPAAGEEINVDISGTYSMTLELQKEAGSPGSGAWETIEEYVGVNTTFADYYRSKSPNERIRLIVTADTSGTATATLTDNHDRDIRKWKAQDGSTAMVLKQSGLEVTDHIEFVSASEAIAASTTLTAAEHANKVLFTGVATTITVTLPAATGSGNVYTLVTGTSATANHIYEVASAADTFVGYAHMNVTTTDTEVFQALAASDTVTLNGTTTGGLEGTLVKFTDAAATKWLVEVEANCSGAQVTPFSAAV
jgi:hypothetical protein